MIPSGWKGFIRAHERTFKKEPQYLMDKKALEALSELSKNMNGLFMLLEARKARREAKNK